MKKMNKYCIIALCIIVFLLSVFVIYKVKERNILRDYYPLSETALYDMSQEEIKAIGIEETWIKTYHAMSSLLNISAERILLFKVQEGKDIFVKDACHEYIKKLKKKFSSSSQMSILNNYKEYQNEEYYILVISKEAEQIMKDIKERICE